MAQPGRVHQLQAAPDLELRPVPAGRPARRQLRQWPDDQRARPQAVVQRLGDADLAADHIDPKGKQVEVWGSARPAHFAKGTQKVQIRFRSGSKGDFKTLKTVTLHNKRGYFDIKMSFPSSGQVKTEWNGMTSRTQNIKVR